MKTKLLVVIALMLALVMTLSGCQAINYLKNLFNPDPYAKLPTVDIDAPALAAEKIIDFAEGANPDVLFESDGWSNGDVFNVVWKSHNVHYEDGIMRLGITEEQASAWIDGAEVPYNYTAGEARTQNYYHYGDYEVSMKPSANGGTASTFFVCTGPYDLKDGVPNAHDEIDIEFLGDDTTHVQFNFFVDGKGGNEYMYDLGFDASEEFHTYGFRWEPDRITWFVDGKPVYMVTTDKSVEKAENVRHVDKIPSTAGRILTNYWCGNERAWGWMGEYKGETHDNGTTYQWIATSAEGAPLNPPVVEPPVGGDDEIDWTAIEPVAPTFETTPEYVVAIDGNKANVTYTDVSGSAYKPIEMDVTEAVAGKNYVYLKVTNNGTETVNVRVNMYDPTLTGNNQATNISATMNGVAVRTDMDWGGSFFDIPAGETAELVINFGVGGVKLQLMIDSSRNDGVLRSGDVTIEEIKFTAVGDVEAPHKCADADEDGKCDECGADMPLPPPVVENPVSGSLSTTIGGATVELGGNTADGYGVHGNEDGTIRVEYTNISTNTYKNVWAQISEVAAGKTEITLKIKNNGAETAYITVKIEAAGAVALMEGKMEIPAGEEHEFKGTFEGVADKLYFFIDSGWSQETTTHAGEVVISEIAFAGGAAPVDPIPEDKVVNISDLTITTTVDEELIPGTGIYASAGLAIDGNKKSIDGFDFTQRLKLGGTMKIEDGVVKAGIQVITNGPAKIVLYAISSSSSDSTRTLQLATLVDGAFNKLAETEGVPGDAVVKIEFTVDAAGTYYIGSTKSGINVYYIAVEAASTPDPEPDPEPTPDPEPDTGLQFEFWTSSDNYTANGHNIKYNGAGNAYSCAGTDIASLAAGKTTFTVTITNNGAAASRVRVDIQGDNQVGNHNVLNTSATGGDVWTDAEWGGSSVTVEPGQSVTLVIEFDVNTERGKPANLIVFVDAARGDGEMYSSDITLSGMAFSGEAPAPADPEPKPEEPKVEYTDLYVEFKTENAYTLTTPDTYANQVRVTYADMAQNSWANINIWVEDKSADCTVFSFKLTNHGSATVSVWVQMKDSAGAELINQNVDIAAGAEQVVTFEYTGTAQMIFFFVDSTHEADAELNTGDITMSELKLGKVAAAE